MDKKYFIIEAAHGKSLDLLASAFGFQRKRWLWIFKERDKTLRKRIYNAIYRW